MNNLKIAVLGLNHGYKFATDAMNLTGVKLIAVAGNNELSMQRARELNVPIYRNYKDLIAECELDGVIITLPNRLHREAVELCARKGLHILVEKPIADTVEDARAVINVCANNNVELVVGHHRRFSSKMMKLKEVIASGRIGKLVGVNMLWMLAKDRAYFEDEWRISEGGGPLLINGIHDIDNLRFVTDLKIDSVFAAARSTIRNNRVEDSASVILEAKAGPIINYFVSDGTPSPWSYEFTAKENPKYRHYDENCYTFFGTKGSITFPSFKLFSYDEDKYGWDYELLIEKIDVEDNDPMAAELEHFINVLRGEEKSLVTGEDALETLKIIDAVKKSIQKGSKVYLSN